MQKQKIKLPERIEEWFRLTSSKIFCMGAILYLIAFIEVLIQQYSLAITFVVFATTSMIIYIIFLLYGWDYEGFRAEGI